LGLRGVAGQSPAEGVGAYLQNASYYKIFSRILEKDSTLLQIAPKGASAPLYKKIQKVGI
jgi:hypothetical protein